MRVQRVSGLAPVGNRASHVNGTAPSFERGAVFCFGQSFDTPGGNIFKAVANRRIAGTLTPVVRRSAEGGLIANAK